MPKISFFNPPVFSIHLFGGCPQQTNWMRGDCIKEIEMKDYVWKAPGSKGKREIWMKTNGKCWYCGKQTHPWGQDRDSFCIDHVVSRKNGGSDNVNNLVPACVYCNTIKKDKTVAEFREICGNFYFEERSALL